VFKQHGSLLHLVQGCAESIQCGFRSSIADAVTNYSIRFGDMVGLQLLADETLKHLPRYTRSFRDTEFHYAPSHPPQSAQISAFHGRPFSFWLPLPQEGHFTTAPFNVASGTAVCVGFSRTAAGPTTVVVLGVVVIATTVFARFASRLAVRIFEW
jgi:hypothetical protein